MGHGLSQVPGPFGTEPRPRPGFLTPHPRLLSQLILGLWTTQCPGEENRGRQGQCLTQQFETEPQRAGSWAGFVLLPRRAQERPLITEGLTYSPL